MNGQKSKVNAKKNVMKSMVMVGKHGMVEVGKR
jgi:hypothetical protein